MARTYSEQDWRALGIRAQLEHYVSTPPVDTEDPVSIEVRNDFWSDILDVQCGGYGTAVDEDVMFVLDKMSRNEFVASKVAHEKGWPASYAEFISYVVCSAGLADYGSSPRGAWIFDDLKDLIPAVIERWRKDN
ncbi:MAG: hypothetical protein QNI84_08005 [Henriciella sp.]|nr:hypothetical protein [Henriciella sp.]